jgi:hypothetical protein
LEEPEYYFDDRTAPWYGNKDYAEKCLNILRSWGVADKKSLLMELLSEVYKTGDPWLLKPKNMHKKFPV